jgi:tetratricopeptide (TPR) repeat protein
MMKRGLLIVALLTANADASVWDHMLTSPQDAAAKELYDVKMLEGDAATKTANDIATRATAAQSVSVENIQASIRGAEAAYRAAAALRPREAEPYFRIGNLLHQMYFACDPFLVRLLTCEPSYATPTQRAHNVEAWNEFEKRAPLDPRIGELLLKRALLNTKLVNGSAGDRDHLEAAARDYQAALDRNDGLSGTRGDEQLLGNLAETYMMLGRLDEAITTYLQAVAVGAARVSTMYGLSVALDRDGSGDQAIRRILEQGAGGFDAFQKELLHGTVFFVPKGEDRYYLALSNEAFGNYGTALELWTQFVASGAHPEFTPRAREHIERLQRKQVHAEPPPPELDDPRW